VFSGLPPRRRGPILECFSSISYHFRRSCTACNVKQWTRRQCRPYGFWCILRPTLRHFAGAKLERQQIGSALFGPSTDSGPANGSVAGCHRFRCLGHPGRDPPRPVPGRPGLSVQGKSALQSLGTHRRQSALSAGPQAGRQAAGIVFTKPNDYWHKPADLPREPWTDAVELIAMADPAKADAAWTHLGRVAFIGPSVSFTDAPASSVNNPDLLARLHYDRAVKTPYELECMRRAERPGRSWPPGRMRRISRRRVRIPSAYELPCRLHAARRRDGPTTISWRTTKRGGAALPTSRAQGARLAALVLDRCGCSVQRLRIGYYADLRRLAGAVADPRRRDEPGAIAGCATKSWRGTTTAKYTCPHIESWATVMHEMGIIRVPGEEALERGVTSVFFPHGIGHLWDCRCTTSAV